VEIVKAVTCPVCGCLCDDIELRIKDRRIVKVKNGCSMCESKFFGYAGHRLLKPLLRKNGELMEVTFKEAVSRAAQILAEASYPIL
jgi:formylmethanofuran dehydrogenase subunit B